VELLEVLVLQGYVPVLNLHSQLPFAKFVRFSKEVIYLVFGRGKIVILSIVVKIMGINEAFTLLSEELINLLSSLIIQASESTVAEVLNGIKVALERSIGDEIQRTFNATASQAEISSSDVWLVSKQGIRQQWVTSSS